MISKNVKNNPLFWPQPPPPILILCKLINVFNDFDNIRADRSYKPFTVIFFLGFLNECSSFTPVLIIWTNLIELLQEMCTFFK